MASTLDLYRHGRVAEYLEQLDFDPHDLSTITVVGDGISGAEKLILSLPGHDVFLKATLRSHGVPGWDRARRECAFYHDLADKVPVWLPYLLASHADDACVLMLFVAYNSRPPQQWENGDWIEVVRLLARMHGAYWGMHRRIGLEWLPSHPSRVSAENIREAATQWRLLSAREDLDRVFVPADQGWIPRLLHNAPAMAEPLDSIDKTLCHGDFHAGNLLLDSENHWIFADWQEVSVGAGLQDLSFLCERALATGCEIPRHEMLMTYHSELEKRVDRVPDPAHLHRAWDITELLSYLLVWPSFLRQAQRAEVELVVWRMRELTRVVLGPE